MSILDDTYRVLLEAGEPLHYREITQRVIAGGWVTEGRTPWDTMNAALAVDVKQRGAVSRFVRTAPGMFALNPARIEPPVATRQPRALRARPEGEAPALSFSDAAEHILRDSGSSEPMHYETITEVAIDQGLIQTRGLTPSATMLSAILQETRRQEARGEQPRFVLHGKGLVGLASRVPRGLAATIASHNAEVRAALLQRLLEGTPRDFEELVGELLAALGFAEVEVTRLSNDNGIDVRGTLVVGEVVRTRMAVQAKRWRNNVQAPAVQQVRGSLGAHEQGLIITTSDFSSGARTEAIRPDAAPVALMNGEQLAALLADHEIGVRREQHYLFSLDALDEPEA